MAVWKTYHPTHAAPWNVERVVHLHRRAAFAATWDEVGRDLNSGVDAAIDRLLNSYQQTESTAHFEALSQNIAQAATTSNNAVRLKAWWFFRMLKSPDPLGERLTLMWHNHFATSNRKVENLVWMLQQNLGLREHARDRFGQLLSAALKQPAMLKWLDADANRNGHPNENLGRELLELFTLGIGNYSEGDVQSAARALTGWTIKDDEFVFRESRHDDDILDLFGAQSKLNGDDLVDRVLQHPAIAKRLAWRICTTFMGETTCDEEALTELAEGLRQRDLNIGWAVETVLRSERFFAPNNIRTRIAGPAEHVVAAIKALELDDPPPSTLQLSEWSTRMGQDLFYPPSVGGWTEGRAWLDSRAVIARCNYANAVSSGRLWRLGSAAPIESSLERLLARHNVASRLRDRADWFAKLLIGKSSAGTIDDVSDGLGDTDTPLADIVGRLLARPDYFLA